MPTKIINILQDDTFESILKIFKDASAKEVIFVLPRKHKALNEEEHFSLLADIAREQGKSVLILSSSSDVSAMAVKYNIGVLTSEKSSSSRSAKKKKEEKKIKISSLKAETEEAEETGQILKVEEPKEETRPNRPIVDIISPQVKEQEKVTIRVEEKSEEPFEVEVKKEEKQGAIDEIESVWRPKPDVDRTAVEERFYQPSSRKPGERSRLSFLNLSRKTLTLLGASVAVIFTVVLYIATGSAQIIIKPKAEAVTLSLRVSASDQFLAIDLEKREIPGQLFSVEKKLEETFKATGERDVAQKARGKLTVYNEYGTTPQVLIVTTRFESEKGLIFRTLKTVTVPGTKVQNGKIIPGTVEVEVIADKAGNAYNIGPGRFTIPAFKEKGDADRHQKFYGTSEEAAKGGIVGKAKVVTEQDLSSAKKKVEERIISETEQEFKSQATGLKILGLSEPTIKETSSTAQADEAIEEFTVSGIAELQTVGFKEADLVELIGQYIGKLNALTILPEKLQIDFSNAEFDKDDKTLKFSITVKGPAYHIIDRDKIMDDLMGKNEGSIKEYIKGIAGVSTAKVILSPFWVRKVPKNIDKIKFELQYE